MYYSRLNNTEEQIDQLQAMKGSPYFVRCDIKFIGRQGTSTFYFGKFGYQQENIFSWIVPAAVMRFEEPGKFSYKSPNGVVIQAELLRKDQFMIIDGKIVYMTTESQSEERQLVHQEYMPSRKSGFVLPEIVQQMEKAQDQVIRAHHKGSFLISGPAGSGKTTLALHRVAYLLQSPETMNLYKSKPIIVFVQDASSKTYFSSLLPSLGINDVHVTTFSEWAMEILNIPEFRFTYRFGETEKEKDLFEYYKTQILKADELEEFKGKKDKIEYLKSIYKETLSKEIFTIFEKQLDEKLLDRFDLAILLQLELLKNKTLAKEKVKYGDRKIKGKYQRITVKEPLEYSLVIMDEVQNYLPEQLNIIKKLVHKSTEAMLYVGDLSQQTQLSTLRNWTDIDEDFAEKRKAVLEKVYRNTKQILEYIQNLGYNVSIPQGIKNGNEVIEKAGFSQSDEISYVQKIIEGNPESVVGVITKNHDYFYEFEKTIGESDKVLFRTINEAQGVEFDIVLLVGIKKKDFAQEDGNGYPTELTEEKDRVNKDLLYVALTRAINELHVLGENSLKEIL
jgi:DNA helicase IV